MQAASIVTYDLVSKSCTSRKHFPSALSLQSFSTITAFSIPQHCILATTSANFTRFPPLNYVSISFRTVILSTSLFSVGGCRMATGDPENTYTHQDTSPAHANSSYFCAIFHSYFLIASTVSFAILNAQRAHQWLFEYGILEASSGFGAFRIESFFGVHCSAPWGLDFCILDNNGKMRDIERRVWTGSGLPSGGKGSAVGHDHFSQAV